MPDNEYTGKYGSNPEAPAPKDDDTPSLDQLRQKRDRAKTALDNALKAQNDWNEQIADGNARWTRAGQDAHDQAVQNARAEFNRADSAVTTAERQIATRKPEKPWSPEEDPVIQREIWERNNPKPKTPYNSDEDPVWRRYVAQRETEAGDRSFQRWYQQAQSDIAKGRLTLDQAMQPFDRAFEYAKARPRLESEYQPGYEPGGPASFFRSYRNPGAPPLDSEQYRNPVTTFEDIQRYAAQIAAPPAFNQQQQFMTPEQLGLAGGYGNAAVATAGAPPMASQPPSANAPTVAAAPQPPGEPPLNWQSRAARSAAQIPGTFNRTPPAASGDRRAQFVQTMLPYARQLEQQTGVPADIAIAMMANESNWGAAGSYFGIKGASPSGQSKQYATWEYENGQRVPRTDTFAVYTDPSEAMQHFASLLNSPRYRDVPRDRNIAYGLQRQGYATNPKWGDEIAAQSSTVRQFMGTGDDDLVYRREPVEVDDGVHRGGPAPVEQLPYRW